MTFAQYIQNLGILLAQWLPICALMYLAVRLGVQHGARHSISTLIRGKAAATLTDEQCNSIGQP